MMTVGSLCSGVGMFDLGFVRAGFRTRWLCEIDDMCRNVLGRRYPGVPVHKDICNVGKDTADPVDIVIGGTPCQGFSMAGLRLSLDDARSVLAFQFVRVCDELDPKWIVWENVRDVLSTKDNAFGCFLAALVGAETPLVPAKKQRWTNAGLVVGPKRAAAWRVFDAQYFGVAQRRKRVFVVASSTPERVAAVLFERKSSGRNTPPRREAGQRVTGPLADSSGNRGWSSSVDTQMWTEVAAPVSHHNERTGNEWNEEGRLVIGPLMAGGNGPRYNAGDEPLVVAHTLRAEGAQASEDGTGRGVPLVLARSQTTSQHRLDGDSDNFIIANTVRPSEGRWQGDGSDNLVVSRDSTPKTADGLVTDLRAGNPHSSAVLVSAFLPNQGSKAQGIGYADEQSPTLKTGSGGGNIAPAVLEEMSVRRLTPVECERLMGLPDGWSEGQSDSARYKQLGNGVVVPNVQWIAEGIAIVEGC